MSTPPVSRSVPSPSKVRVDRRHFLLAGGALALFTACRSGSSSTAGTTTTTGAAGTGRSAVTSTSTAAGAGGATITSGATTTTGAGAALAALRPVDFEPLGTCALVPETTSGPFPLDEQFLRRDITEGYPGHPVRLGLRVVDASCRPVAGAAVEIWHADATGDYSAFADNGGGKDEGTGTTFLRGTQVADSDGIVEFLTIFPGWYSGRAVHIHLRVHVDEATVLTSQLYFDEDHTAAVHAGGAYADNGPPDTSIAADPIAGDPEEEGTLIHVRAAETSRGAGTLGLLNLGIDPGAVSTGGFQGGPPGGRP